MPSVSTEEMDPFAQALTRLSDEGLALEISDRTFRLVDPIRGDAGAAALRMLGMVQAAAPVAIATHSAMQVAAAVWTPPSLYVVRWARNRWVVGYRLAGGSRPNDYVRTEGKIPGHLETGHWYESVPDEVSETFTAVGLSLDLAAVPGAGPAGAPGPHLPPCRRRVRWPGLGRREGAAHPAGAPQGERPQAPAGPEAAGRPHQPGLPRLQHASHPDAVRPRFRTLHRLPLLAGGAGQIRHQFPEPGREAGRAP